MLYVPFNHSYTPDAKSILDLHMMTKAPMLECRRSLIETAGNIEKALGKIKENTSDKRSSLIELYR